MEIFTSTETIVHGVELCQLLEPEKTFSFADFIILFRGFHILYNIPLFSSIYSFIFWSKHPFIFLLISLYFPLYIHFSPSYIPLSSSLYPFILLIHILLHYPTLNIEAVLTNRGGGVTYTSFIPYFSNRWREASIPLNHLGLNWIKL